MTKYKYVDWLYVNRKKGQKLIRDMSIHEGIVMKDNNGVKRLQ